MLLHLYNISNQKPTSMHSKRTLPSFNPSATILRLIVAFMVIATPFRVAAEGSKGSSELRNNVEKFQRYLLENYDQALHFATRAEGSIDSLSTEVSHAEVLEFLADHCEFHTFRYTEALGYKMRAHDIYHRTEALNHCGRMMADIGRLHFKVGNYHDAFSFSSRALAEATTLGDTLSIREATMTIELVNYFYYKDTAKALEYNRQVADNYYGMEQARQAMRALNNRFHYNPSPNEVEEIVTRSEAIHAEFESKDIIINTYLNMAMQQVLYDDLDLCRHYLDLAEPLISNFKEEGYFYSARGFYHINTGNTQQAIDDTRRSIELLSKGDFDEKNVHSYFLLQELYYEGGRYREAHEALMQFAEIYTRQNSTSSVVELSKLINELEKEYADTQLRKEQEYLAEQMARSKERNTLIIVILMLVIVSLAIGLSLFYSRQRLERKHQRLIDEKAEQEINSKNEIIKIQKLQQFQEQRNMAELTRELNEALLLDEKQMRTEIKRTIARAEKRSNTSGDWVEVEKMLVDSNDVFFENLKREFPNLTKNERKLCTFIHLNLSTKEISKITHQSVGSINIARSRLRHKFGITGDNQSLIAFLDRFKSPEGKSASKK